jgi:hypothetical protein
MRGVRARSHNSRHNRKHRTRTGHETSERVARETRGIQMGRTRITTYHAEKGNEAGQCKGPYLDLRLL